MPQTVTYCHLTKLKTEATEMMANQCVVCGSEMPEGDQVCKACREGNGKSAITKITTIAEFLENLGEKQMAAELAGAVRTLKGERA